MGYTQERNNTVHPIGKQWGFMYETKSFGIAAKQSNKIINIGIGTKAYYIQGYQGWNSPMMS